MLNREDFIRIVKEEMTRFFAKEIVKEEIFHWLSMTEDGEVELHSEAPEPPKEPDDQGMDASDQAKALGLHHIGWGRYADQTGKEVAKVVRGPGGRKILVKLEPKSPEQQQQAQQQKKDNYFNNLSKRTALAKKYNGRFNGAYGKYDLPSQLPASKDMYAQAGHEEPDTGDQHDIGAANATMPAASVPQSQPVTHMVSKQNHDEPYANQDAPSQPVVKPNATPTDDPYSDTPHVLRGARPEKYKTSEFGNNNNQTIARAVKAMKSGQGSPEQQQAVKAQLDKMRQPGSITPPKTSDGKAWEVNTPDGRHGMIDFINRDDREAHVTFDDGSMDMVPLNQLNPTYPTNKQPEPEGPLFPGDQGDSPGPWDEKQ